MPRTRNGIISAEIDRAFTEIKMRRGSAVYLEMSWSYDAVSCDGV